MVDIGWGSYKEYEGPYCWGYQPFKLSSNPSFEEEVLAVITATEGGKWDAVNRYDRCIDTQGLIQWCNRATQHSVDDLYGALYEKSPEFLRPVTTWAEANGYSFKKVDGKYRFVSTVAGTVDTPKEQQYLYFKRATGLRGGWDADSKAYAIEACKASVQVWQAPETHRLQAQWTVARLGHFIVGKAKDVFSAAPDNDCGRAFKAMYWSFAANNPKKAADALDSFLKDVSGVRTPWTNEWLASLGEYLTFRPQVAIYPHRYDKIRPVIEALYGVDLPDNAKQLEQWKKDNAVGTFWDPKEVQKALKELGYDIGPAGADGIFGKRSKQALLDFETDQAVPSPDGEIDIATAHLLEKALNRHRVSSGA